jgi:hypothetical protein
MPPTDGSYERRPESRYGQFCNHFISTKMTDYFFLKLGLSLQGPH